MFYQREFTKTIIQGLQSPANLLQIIIGPRQVGKTTTALHIEKVWEGQTVYASADEPLPPGPEWIMHHWQTARRTQDPSTLLILDEVQKVRGWSEVVKSLWEEDKRCGLRFAVMLLGSSSLLIQKGLSESLSGRFMLHRCSHWSYNEMSTAFSLSLDEWLYFGGYPGTIDLRKDITSWKGYVRDSLIETVLNKDIFQLQNIAKPALFRHLFMLAAGYPAEILSYNKMLGQLQDAGNTTTLSHYIDLLSSAFLVDGLELYKIRGRPKRGSSPKLIIRNNALINALSNKDYTETQNDTGLWGRIVENAVGAHLLNCLCDITSEIYYWRSGNFEVDFIIQTPGKTWAVEVKSGRMKIPRGLEKFLLFKKDAFPFILGGTGMPLEEFFTADPKDIFL